MQRDIYYISLPIRTNDKPLEAIGKFPKAISKLRSGKAWPNNGRKLPMLSATYPAGF